MNGRRWMMGMRQYKRDRFAEGSEHMQLSGAEIMCRILAEEGVTTVFGYPGGAILPFYDALRQSPIQHILTALRVLQVRWACV